MQNIKIPILMYHSIESMPKTTVMRSLHVPPRRFDFQMRMLKMLGYQALSLKKLKPYLDGKKQGKVVGITFDDGYQNNLMNAAPILLKYNAVYIEREVKIPPKPPVKPTLKSFTLSHFDYYKFIIM